MPKKAGAEASETPTNEKGRRVYGQVVSRQTGRSASVTLPVVWWGEPTERVVMGQGGVDHVVYDFDPKTCGVRLMDAGERSKWLAGRNQSHLQAASTHGKKNYAGGEHRVLVWGGGAKAIKAADAAIAAREAERQAKADAAAKAKAERAAARASKKADGKKAGKKASKKAGKKAAPKASEQPSNGGA